MTHRAYIFIGGIQSGLALAGVSALLVGDLNLAQGLVGAAGVLFAVRHLTRTWA